jgi:hypothetical protein
MRSAGPSKQDSVAFSMLAYIFCNGARPRTDLQAKAL